MSCARCVAAHKLENGLIECRRHPPFPAMNVDGAEHLLTEQEPLDYSRLRVFPIVAPDDHCADFVHRV